MAIAERWTSGVNAELSETAANELTHRKRHAKVTGFRVTRQRCPQESCSELWNRKQEMSVDAPGELWMCPGENAQELAAANCGV